MSVIQKIEMWLSNTCIGLNIFVITELTITTLFARVWTMQHRMCWRGLCCFSSKGLSDYHFSETVVKAARRRPAGRIKGLLLGHIYSNRESWKAALCLTEKGQKTARQRKSTTDKKRKMFTLNSGCCWRREGWWRWRCRWMRIRCADHKSMLQHFSVWGLSPKKVGLNRQPKAWFSPNT